MLKSGATNERPARHKTATPITETDDNGQALPITKAQIVPNYPDLPARLA